MAAFDITSVMGAATLAQAAPAPSMVITMIPAGDIIPNPENKIYKIGDISTLKADIDAQGLRQPLEVVRSGRQYMLIAGHRRYTACTALAETGDQRFNLLPCVVRVSNSAVDDRIALIMSNATARELTDGERLDQYEALKAALEAKKAAGELEGRVRDEMAAITGSGTGTLARLNAVSAKCTNEVKQLIRDGQCSLGKAYESSKLYRCQQAGYIKNGYSGGLPDLTAAERAVVFDWLYNHSRRAFMAADYAGHSWAYLKGVNMPELVDFADGDAIDLPGGVQGIISAKALKNKYGMLSVVVFVENTEILGDMLRSSYFYYSGFFNLAKAEYGPAEDNDNPPIAVLAAPGGADADPDTEEATKPDDAASPEEMSAEDRAWNFLDHYADYMTPSKTFGFCSFIAKKVLEYTFEDGCKLYAMVDTDTAEAPTLGDDMVEFLFVDAHEDVIHVQDCTGAWLHDFDDGDIMHELTKHLGAGADEN